MEAQGPNGIAGFMRRFLEDWERYTAPVSIAIRMEGGRMSELHFFLERDDALGALG